MWGFRGVREYAISQIDRWYSYNMQNPIERLNLADECGIPRWRLGAFCALCNREQPPTLEEASRLGMERLVAFCRVREEHYASRQIAARGTTVFCPDHDGSWKEIECPHQELMTLHQLENALRDQPELESEYDIQVDRMMIPEQHVQFLQCRFYSTGHVPAR